MGVLSSRQYALYRAVFGVYPVDVHIFEDVIESTGFDRGVNALVAGPTRPAGPWAGIKPWLS
jgi:hypothetical protein